MLPCESVTSIPATVIFSTPMLLVTVKSSVCKSKRLVVVPIL